MGGALLSAVAGSILTVETGIYPLLAVMTAASLAGIVSTLSIIGADRRLRTRRAEQRGMTGMTMPSTTDFPAVIIAGGLSSRMGQDKSSLPLGTLSMIERIIERLKPQVSHIAVNTNAVPPLLLPEDIPAFPDSVAGRLGPLAGVLSALRQTGSTPPRKPGRDHGTDRYAVFPEGPRLQACRRPNPARPDRHRPHQWHHAPDLRTLACVDCR